MRSRSAAQGANMSLRSFYFVSEKRKSCSG
nr:MAG TPA: hypothetical protein [Caudoviricetes sp.]